MHVCADSPGFSDQQRSRGVIPDLFLIIFTAHVFGGDAEAARKRRE